MILTIAIMDIKWMFKKRMPSNLNSLEKKIDGSDHVNADFCLTSIRKGPCHRMDVQEKKLSNLNSLGKNQKVRIS